MCSLGGGWICFCSLCKRTGLLQWMNNVLIIAFLYPGIVFGILFDLKLIMWSYHSAPAILFTTLLALLLSFQHFDMYLDSTVLPIKINMSRERRTLWLTCYPRLLTLTFELYLQLDFDFCSLYFPHFYLQYN